jgi:hypothetical protein
MISAKRRKKMNPAVLFSSAWGILASLQLPHPVRKLMVAAN